MLDPSLRLHSQTTAEPETSQRLRDRPIVRSKWAYLAIVLLFDATLGAVVTAAAVRWRYDFLNIPVPNGIEETAAMIAFVLCVVVWSVMRVPRAIWRYTSLDDVLNLGQAVLLVMLLLPLFMYLFVNSGVGFPRSTPLIAGPVFLLGLVLSRMAILIFRNGDVRGLLNKTRKDRRNAVLAGSGSALYATLRDMRRSPEGSNVNIVGLLTTDYAQSGRSIRGVPVIGTLSNLGAAYAGLTKKYGEPPHIIAVDPRPNPRAANALVKAAADIGAPLSRLQSGTSLRKLTPFEAQDLIGRRPRSLDLTPVKRLVGGRRVLITGAGGSIGSEIVRQVLNLDPAHVTLVDNSEFNLYSIEREVSDMHGSKNAVHGYLGDVCNVPRMREIFRESRPEVIFHAAALKHVPLGERNPLETLYTNVKGTRVVLQQSVACGASSFTLISTDKAVNASNIMGASKRIAELLTHAYNSQQTSLYACAVRFGNVLASAGSVIPLFEDQIARGGPVTVTHPEATRYFMTTEEASALVLQAAALNATQRKADSSTYVLEMGEPVNIARLARQLISLRGKVPDRDVEIVFSGLREGETLGERVVGEPETLESTYVDGVLRIQSAEPDPDTIFRHVDSLLEALDARDIPSVNAALGVLIPEDTPKVGQTEDGAASQASQP